MFVFLDESGTPALHGSQPYFAMSSVAFETEASRDLIEEAVKRLRLKWGMSAAFEFKFIKLDGEKKAEFFATVGKLPFNHSSCVLWKDGLSGKWSDKRYVYERVIREVVIGLEPYFRQADEAQEKPLRA